tara:strand:- start:2042 stop:4279 length:2238 start_codon:yes stop_codon:yes gene_type:complete
MTGFDPFLVEQKFNETVRMIQSSPSERIQISGIEHFIDEVWEYRMQVSSYLEQLLQYLPDLSNPLLLAGIHPHRFSKFIHHIETIVEELNDYDTEQRLREYKQSLLLLKSWIGEKESDNLEKLTGYYGTLKPEYKPGEVLIPVVEEFKGTEKHSGIGRLRKLRVDIIGENKKGGSELTPAFGVIGKDSGSFLQGVVSSAEKLLAASKKGKYRNWKATAHLSMSHAWHAGRSANLALAAAFFCEMLKAEETAEFFRMNPAVCISGDVDEFGNVLPVEGESLELKTEAAFFFWVQVLVVPAAQLQEVQQVVDTLREKFPNRELPLFGVSKIEELFYDRRLTIHEKTDTIVHNFRKVWKRKFSVASVITVLVLLGVIARLVYGPVDRNPTYVTYEGEFAYIRNEKGAVLESINVGENYVKYYNNNSKSEIADHLKFIDVNNDGLNEILENNTTIEHPDKKENFIIRSNNGDTLFNREFKLDIPFDKHPYVKEGLFGIRRFLVTDFDKDGTNELLMILSYSAYFSNLLVVVDIETGNINEMYVNAGYLRDIYITDLENDGFDDILLATEFKAYREKGFIVLDSRFISGKGILGERYKKSDIEKAIEKAAIFIPQTLVGKVLSKDDYRNGFEKGFPDYFSNIDETIFTFFVKDWHESRGDGAGIMFEFYSDLSVRSVVSQDSYDIKAKELFDTGRIPFEADGLYLDTYRDSLLYWNGTEFQSTPTLNKKYLEAVGDDSTFYKDFFFKTVE